MMSAKSSGIAFLLGFAVFGASATIAAQTPAGAKALFYDPATGTVLPTPPKPGTTPGTPVPVRKPSATVAPKFVGVHYWMELEGKGPVSDTYAFHTGDRIKIHVRSNVDGYLSLWAMEPNGEGKLLLPTAGKDAKVTADTDYLTPDFIKFSEPVQDERLLVFFSRSKTELPSNPKTASESTQKVGSATGSSGAKSLVMETDDKDQGQIGTYVVNRDGGPVAKEIKLRHLAKG